MNTRTQEAKVIDFLATGRGLTPLVALRRWGVMRLGARVYGLKRKGHRIDSKLVKRGDSRVAEYRLVQ